MLVRSLLIDTVLLFLVLAIGASADVVVTTFTSASAVLVFTAVVNAMPVSVTMVPNSIAANNSYLNDTSPPSVMATVQTIDHSTTHAMPVSVTMVPNSVAANNSYLNDTSPPSVTVTVQTIDRSTTHAMPVSVTMVPNSVAANNSYLNYASPPSVMATVQTIDHSTTPSHTTTFTGPNTTEGAAATGVDRLSPIQEGNNPPRKGLARSTIVAVVVCPSLFLLFLGAIHLWAKYYRPDNFSIVGSTIVAATRPGVQANLVAPSGRKQ
ncbi:hypothetical protein DXG01_008705 [Tephrocybe rancida]|nr:hypothetical protein DXG01_008705 [Tephrocybe rancida]